MPRRLERPAGQRRFAAAVRNGLPAVASSRGTIVLADDDIATRMLLSRVLTRASFTVVAVENGALACEAVRARRPDLILLDWIMPVMDGREAVEALKADSRTRDIPIVMLTTHSRSEERSLALEAGVQDFLTKPFEAHELIARIERQIGDAVDDPQGAA